jgi:glycosyltransferase involved in cell wall biosynthesis
VRVLLLHNRYRAPGGEERALAEIAALLERRGHVVGRIERSSQALARGVVGPGRAGAGLLVGGLEPGEVAAAVRRMRADVLHAHNVHPLFGWRALAAARTAGARTVLHLHNFRLFCAIAVAYRDGAPCHRCRGRNTLAGLRLNCRGSWAEAVVYAAGLSRQQRRLFEHADAFIAVSRAHRARLEQLGLPAGRTTTLPNFVASRSLAASSAAADGRYALCVGRLVEEKGFDTAIAACRRANVPLVIVGDGPDAGRLERLAAGAEVELTGRLSPERLAEVRRGAAVALVPSRWEEPCPYSVLDALAAGVPVLVSRRGGLPEMVAEGWALPADDAGAWAAALTRLWCDAGERRRRGERALQIARDRFDEEAYFRTLMKVYGDGAVEPAGG